jgi:hypothetical protein
MSIDKIFPLAHYSISALEHHTSQVQSALSHIIALSSPQSSTSCDTYLEILSITSTLNRIFTIDRKQLPNLTLPNIPSLLNNCNRCWNILQLLLSTCFLGILIQKLSFTTPGTIMQKDAASSQNVHFNSKHLRLKGINNNSGYVPVCVNSIYFFDSFV